MTDDTDDTPDFVDILGLSPDGHSPADFAYRLQHETDARALNRAIMAVVGGDLDGDRTFNKEDMARIAAVSGAHLHLKGYAEESTSDAEWHADVATRAIALKESKVTLVRALAEEFGLDAEDHIASHPSRLSKQGRIAILREMLERRDRL